VSRSLWGASIKRSEDHRFVTGYGRFLEDVSVEDVLHVAFVRSTMAHARIADIDTGAARSMGSVVGVYTASDLGLKPRISDSVADGFERPPLAVDVVRFVGEPVVAVLAESKMDAFDAAEQVSVSYVGLPVVVDPLRSVDDDAPLLFPNEGTNVVWEENYGFDADVLEGAEITVSARFQNQRVAPAPMEVNGALAVPSSEGGLTLWVPCQLPFAMRREVAGALSLTEDQVRIVVPSVGGSFGSRVAPYAEQLVVAALALRLGRPIRYSETRSENMVAMTHGRGQIQDVAIGAMRDGSLVGLQVRVLADAGAYPGAGASLPVNTRQMASGVYRIPRIGFKATSVVTNTTPIGSYRGAGRPEATALIERIMDMLAAALDMDPVELRRKNLIRKDAFPFTTAAGATYDSGDYEKALMEATRLARYGELRGKQRASRQRGDNKLLGIGVSCYVEVTGWGSEFAKIEVDRDGRVTVTTGTTPHGQGHETAWAQLAADVLGLPVDAIEVVHSDTGLVASGEGTSGSRSLQIGGSAVFQASNSLLDKAKELASTLLEVPVTELVRLPGGRFGSATKPDCALPWAEIASAASKRRLGTAEEGLSATANFEQDGNTYPFGTHVAVVEVDVGTGQVKLLRLIAVDDCGRILNPMLVEGQIQGGIAQGVGQSLFEEVIYDDLGNLLTAGFASYAIPGAPDLPSFETVCTETATPLNPLGAKGVGESGTIGSTPAVQNAVIDALAHLGIRHIDMPLGPQRVWQAIKNA
jgi:aerobic carbon-monoxide dehydrogenase large subunit